VYGRAPRPAGWDLDKGLGDEHCDRVEVAGVCFEAETLGLKRDGAATAEGVEDGWRVIAAGAPDLCSSLGEDAFVVGVLPLH
jgi:hypothetical protein